MLREDGRCFAASVTQTVGEDEAAGSSRPGIVERGDVTEVGRSVGLAVRSTLMSRVWAEELLVSPFSGGTP